MSVRQVIRNRMAEVLRIAAEAKKKEDNATAVEMYLRHDECKKILKKIRQ